MIGCSKAIIELRTGMSCFCTACESTAAAEAEVDDNGKEDADDVGEDEDEGGGGGADEDGDGADEGEPTIDGVAGDLDMEARGDGATKKSISSGGS